jgi:hypothetical protein
LIQLPLDTNINILFVFRELQNFTSAGVPTKAPVAPAAIPNPAFMKNPKTGKQFLS